MSEAQIVVGKISGVFGVQGWLKIHAYTDPLDNILSHQPWLLKLRENITEMRIEAGRQQGKSIIARFPGCSTREQAEQWIGAEISVLRSCLPALQGREYYWIDLLGCEVSTAQGERLGRVTQLIDTGANDVLIVTGERERLIPFILDQVVVQVDIAQATIVVDWDPEF